MSSMSLVIVVVIVYVLNPVMSLANYLYHVAAPLSMKFVCHKRFVDTNSSYRDHGLG